MYQRCGRDSNRGYFLDGNLLSAEIYWKRKFGHHIWHHNSEPAMVEDE
jgi:hypothetical protein